MLIFDLVCFLQEISLGFVEKNVENVESVFLGYFYVDFIAVFNVKMIYFLVSLYDNHIPQKP